MATQLDFNQAKYTMRFADFIQITQDTSTFALAVPNENIRALWTSGVDILEAMPSVNETVGSYAAGNFYTDFMFKYIAREIGQETMEGFITEFYRVSCTVYNKYYWKLNEYIDKRDTMDDRQISDSSTNTDTEEGTVSNEYDNYYNPLGASTDNIIGKNTNETGRDITVTRKYTGYKYFGWTKTNAEIMKQILEIQDLYNEALNEFQVLFMGVL